MKIIFYIILIQAICFLSCKENEETKIKQLVKEWQGKEIIFPKQIIFTKFAKDTVDYQIPNTDYKVLVYIDSVGCTGCKLQLPKWKEFIAYTDSITGHKIPFLFFFHSNDYKEMHYLFKVNNFDRPVCLDIDDQLNKLNKFPKDTRFQTFLLDKDNKVTIFGSPIYNLAVKDLYLKQLTKKESPNNRMNKTTAIAEKNEIDLGTIKMLEAQKATFIIKNTGKSPLVILDISTTCGCITSSYDKQPAESGKVLQIEIIKTPENKGLFDETITVKCNTEQPIKLKIKGNVR